MVGGGWWVVLWVVGGTDEGSPLDHVGEGDVRVNHHTILRAAFDGA